MSVAGDLTLAPSTVIEIGIDGPSSSLANSGRIVLPTGSLTADGTLRTTLVGEYVPDVGNEYALISCLAGNCSDETFAATEVAPFELAPSASAIRVTNEDPSLTLTISPSDPTPSVGVGSIAIADLPAAVFQGYGGTTSDYATSDLKTLDLRADLGAPNGDSTPVADVTLAQLELDRTPITRRLLNTILLPEIPIEGGWSRALRPASTELLVEQTISLLDVYDESASGGRYPGATARIELGALGLQASNLGSISTYAALLAGVSVTQLPFPAGARTALDYWCGQVDAAGLDCLDDFGVNVSTGAGGENLTLPVLSFAGIDIERADLLGSPLVRPNADGTGDIVVNLAGTPIGDRALGDLNLGVVPLASQPLVPSKSLPSFIPVTPQIPDVFKGITLGELAGATPLGALTPADLGLDGVLLSTGDRPVPAGERALDLDHRADSPLSDYQWAQPAPGAGLLLASEAAAVRCGERREGVGSRRRRTTPRSAARPTDPPEWPRARRRPTERASCRHRAVWCEPFGASPFGASRRLVRRRLVRRRLVRRRLVRRRLVRRRLVRQPFGASPFGASPFGASPFGASPFGASPFGAVPFGASPFGASPFGASPFGASPVWCVAVWCQSVWCVAVWCVAVWCQSRLVRRRSPVWCQSVWCVAVWCQPVWCVAVRCEPVRCVSVRCVGAVRTRALGTHRRDPPRRRRRRQAARPVRTR